MRASLTVGFLLAILTSAALAISSHRFVLVVGRPDDARVQRQMALLASAREALDERDVVVQSLTPEAARRERPELGVGPAASFEVLLVGRDGGVKLRRAQNVSPAEIAARIDTMPMRQQEMKR